MKPWMGHLLAFAAILIWGMTFISSKIILGYLDPYWYIVIRFVLAWLVLFLLSPRRLPLLGKKQEGVLCLCGLTGVLFYYVFQNVGLLYSTASNVGVITAASPLFTALILCLFKKQVQLRPLYFIGFVLCMGGVVGISFAKGGGEIHVLGDFFALLAAIAWGTYCVQILRTDSMGLTSLQTTRKIFFWGTLLCIPAALLLGDGIPLSVFTEGGLTLWGNLFFVSVCSSALCYLFWGIATREIGAVATSLYLYLMTVVTVIGSFFVLHESITWKSVLCIVAILFGVILSQKGIRWRQKIQNMRKSSCPDGQKLL